MNSVPKFIRLLYDALETSAYTFLHWDERGTSFRVSLTQLAKNLDHLFGKISIGTFVKQMNNYKFKVQKVSKDIKIYSNKNFVKGNKQELQKLHRRIQITREPDENTLEAIQYENLQLCQKLMEIKQNQDKLVKSLYINQEIYKLLVNRIYNIYLSLSNQINLDNHYVEVKDQTVQLFFTLVSGSQPRLREILSFFMIEAIEPMCQWEYDVDGLANCIFEI